MTTEASATRWVSRLTSHIPPGQFLRYLVVAVWNTVFGYSVYALFVVLLTPRMPYAYSAAQIISFLINSTVAYFGYKFFVFKTKANYLKEWIKCLLVYGCKELPGLFVLPLVVFSLRASLHLHRSAPYVAGALLLGISAIYTFVGHKQYTFRVPGAVAPPERENETLSN